MKCLFILATGSSEVGLLTTMLLFEKTINIITSWHKPWAFTLVRVRLTPLALRIAAHFQSDRISLHSHHEDRWGCLLGSV